MRIGIDIGSTTIKCVVIDDNDEIVYSEYNRHGSHILVKAQELLGRLMTRYPKAYLGLSGSAGMGLAEALGVNLVQEVFATHIAADKLAPNTDCIIELGGEDAKILFLSNGLEVRMNGSCAGGTGAFIDQMASLLKLDSAQMDKEALKAERIYEIASRCGVFAKSDVQPLINQGAAIADIAASIYQAVANQTIAGLAQGRPIKGNIMYLGGPLTFSDCLKATFDRLLATKGHCPENSLYYVAIGSALYTDQIYDLRVLYQKLQGIETLSTCKRLPPLFESEAEYEAFVERHSLAQVPRGIYQGGSVHIGVDSGSTTIKLVVIDEKGSILHSWYRPNDGNPVQLLRDELLALFTKYPDLKVASLTTTGYGEELIKQAFGGDFGIVETTAHFIAAKYFMPDVDFIIDIGGQDMKCFKIENGAVSDIFLNEACSSGCGSFLQTFAKALNYDVETFAKLGLKAQGPVDLGSRCTVFMNSSVKQAQKDGAQIEDISAGLSISVVKNALYKVIRCADPKQLGQRIVVQGGTFYNEAVLRAFEKEMGVEAIRPDIAGLMGAFGAALYGLRHSEAEHISLLNKDGLLKLEHKTTSTRCKGCGNHCLLTINSFTQGSKPYISGSRCDKPLTGKSSDDHLNLYAQKLSLLKEYGPLDGKDDMPTIGLPLALNMYELLPFWYRLFAALGFGVKVSEPSDRQTYQLGQTSIPSDTVCYPAKLVHGHIEKLIKEGVDYIFYPCMSYNVDEGLGDNHYNCPIVAYYPEVIDDNCDIPKSTKLIRDFVDISNHQRFKERFPKILIKYFPQLKLRTIQKAINEAYEEYEGYRKRIVDLGKEIVAAARAEQKHIIILAGRPYHIDPEVNHGIDKLLVKLNLAVITEDAVASLAKPYKTSVLNQWTYHSRLYAAAHYCKEQQDMDLVQLVSFGCGLDAITGDETREILQQNHKFYTQIKIDEIANLGAANIRLRSLIAAIQEQQEV